MAKQSREQIIAELNARKIGYSEDMSYAELCELLTRRASDGAAGTSRQEQAHEGKQAEQVAPPKVEQPIDYSNIRCGLSTIQDLHRRITLLERRMIEISQLRQSPV